MKKLTNILMLCALAFIATSCNNDDDSNYQDVEQSFVPQGRIIVDSIKLDTIKNGYSTTNDNNGPGPCHKWECIKVDL